MCISLLLDDEYSGDGEAKIYYGIGAHIHRTGMATTPLANGKWHETP